MHLKSKLTFLAAVALPLAGLATFGGSQLSQAAAGPALTCTQVTGGNTEANSAVTFTSGGNTTGISLSSAPGQAAALVDNAFNGNASIVINKAVVVGQTLTVAGFTGTYVVTSDSYPGYQAGPPASILVTPDTVGLNMPLAGNVGKGGETKIKGAVTVNATDGTNGTVTYNGSVTENVNLALSSCTSSNAAAGDFSPTQVGVVATAPGSNSAAQLEQAPADLNGTVTFPSIGSDYVQPVSTAIGFNTAKSDTLNLSDFALTYSKGLVTGDYGTTKAELQLSALAAMTVCSQGELQAIATGTGPDAVSGTDPTHTAIAEGANPLVVCDSGTNPAFPSASGLGEILSSETAPPGTTVDATDGTPIGAIYAIQVAANGNNVI